jgi:outer membrane autotransporter protein
MVGLPSGGLLKVVFIHGEFDLERNFFCLIYSLIILVVSSIYVSPVFSAQVIANGTTVNLNGGTASTTADNTPAILSINNGLVNSNGSTVTTTGNNSNGATATQSGHIVFNGSNISTTGISSFGVYAAQNGVIDLFGPFISTTGANAAGVVADAAGTINLNGPTIQTSGTNAAGILALPGGIVSGSANVTTNNTGSPAFSAAGGTITYTGGSIATHGDSSPAFSASSGGVLTGSGFGEQTTGANSPVASATSGGSISLTSAGLQTSGVGSFGAFASGAGSNITISNASVTTTGNNATGFVATNGGSISLTNASLATSGSNAPALMLSNGGVINLTNANANAQGSNSAGVIVDNSAGASPNTLNIINGSLHSNSSDAINVNGAQLTVNANQGTINAGSNNILTFATNGALVNLNGDNNSQFSGAIISDGSSNVNLSLTNNSTWSGNATSLNNLTIDSSSTWNMDANSTVNGAFNVSGTISFQTTTNNFKTLTVNETYTGQNGTVVLNTLFAGDNSPSDTLVINGGNASGSTQLVVLNTDGLGDTTTGNGILVVNALNGGTTESNAFNLAIPAVGGPYEYYLVRGARDGSNSHAWYLVNTFDNPPDDPPIPPGGVGDVTPPFAISDEIPIGRNIPFYSREVSLAAAIPSFALLYDHFILDTLHERVGEQEQIIQGKGQTTRPYVNGVWIRIMEQSGTFNHNGIYRSGPSFNYYFNALQLGVDIYHDIHQGGSSDFAGITGIYGKTHGNVDHVKIVNAGRNNFDAWSAGAYYTHYDPHGWYVDTVLLNTFHQIDANSERGFPSFIVSGSGLAGSIETGYNIGSSSLSIEPQAQLVLERLWLNNARSNAGVSFDATNSLLGRLGARLTTGGFPSRFANAVTAWLFGNFWHEFAGNSITRFATQTQSIPFNSNLGINWTELGAGISALIRDNVSIYASGKYINYRNGHGNGGGGELGVRWNI